MQFALSKGAICVGGNDGVGALSFIVFCIAGFGRTFCSDSGTVKMNGGEGVLDKDRAEERGVVRERLPDERPNTIRNYRCGPDRRSDAAGSPECFTAFEEEDGLNYVRYEIYFHGFCPIS